MFPKLYLLCMLAVISIVVTAQTPTINAKKRTAAITLDGNPNESIWDFSNSMTKPIVGTPNNTAKFAVLWDSLNLYVAFTITDAAKFFDSANPWDDDACEIYIDADNNGGTSYGTNDRQFVKAWNSTTIWEKNGKTTGVQHKWVSTGTGYTMEILIPWSNIGITNPQPGRIVGFDVGNDDDDNGAARESQLLWAGDNDNWQYPRNFGDLVLVTTTDTQAPTAPANLAASALTQSSLTLGWTASTDNVAVTGYDVYRNGTKINTALVTATSYSVTGLTAATAYQFYVVARDAANNTSASSNVVNVTTPDMQAPTAPANPTASAVTQTTLTLSWTASTDNVAVAGYDVFQNNVKINTANITATTYNVTGLSASTLYSFYIKARDAAGNSTNSTTLNVTTLASPDVTPPSVPTGLAASNVTQSTATLTWTASTDNVGVAGYDVYRNTVKINTTVVTTTTYNVTGLSAATAYAFYVVARDAAGNISGSSNTANITTPDTQAPTAPTNLAASAITATTLTLNWTAATDNVAVTSYDVYQNSVKINTDPVTTLTYNVTGLTQGTTYSFFVKASDAAGNVSANSTTLNATTTDTQAPAAPTGLVSSNITSSAVTLSWTAATDNIAVTGYDVYQNNVKINTANVASTTYAVSGLTASTTYNFYVVAKDAAGNVSAASNTLSVTTAVSTSCAGTGAINYQKWNNVTGTAVSNLTSLSTYPNSPSVSGTLTSFEIPVNSSDNYGMRVYGYICPPVTGTYTFWIASDDNGELWLSTNSSPANKQKIAYQSSWTNSREWNKVATQKSAAITLTAGQLYYVEALMKEGTGGDNLAVGWAKPGEATTAPSEVIPGTQLIAQIPDSQAPTAPLNLRSSNLTQNSITLNWMPATDNIGVTGYDVYNSSNVKINTATVTTLYYVVPGLAASTSYTFYVKAKDAAGNVSANSNNLTASTTLANPTLETFTKRTVIANQRMPHDLVYGPDNNIWYTERFAGTVSYVNPQTGAKTVVLSLGSKFVLVSGQDGLLGLALHPQFNQGKPYVYISYTYQSLSSTVRKIRIERYTYDSIAKTLGQPVTILEDIPGSNDHNSARIAIGPDLKLYYSAGDMGAGQFDNSARAENAQNINILEGKILRLNTELTGGSWIPTDNPFTNAGATTPVYSYGHRNPQGLVWGNVNGTPILYSSEHGPYSDDELNIIEQGRNYGWPMVAGFCDGNYNGRYLGGLLVTNEQNSCVTYNVKEPLRSLFPAITPPDSGTNNLTWPSTAPSGTDFYGSNAIPGWQNSLLVAELKAGAIARFKLSSDGQSVISDTINYFKGMGRFRDVVVSPDGLKIYVACDSSGSTSGPTGGVTSTPANPGSILEFTYQPSSGLRSIAQLATIAVAADTVRNKTIDIYPNPASTYTVVFNYSSAQGRNIVLMDMNGKILKRQALVNIATRVEFGNVANGLYLMNVLDADGKVIRTQKIIIQK